LLPRKDTVIDRPLIAFAFLAQATQVQGDLMSGLAPIFKPIVKQHVGEKFDADEFAETVGKLYGIKIHPWAVDELATRLEKAGLLVRIGDTLQEYAYADVEGTFDEVTEADILRVVQRFIEFSRPLLERFGAEIDEKVLEDGFFDELTSIDFHSVLLKPERRETKPSTLTMPKSPEEARSQTELTARAHLDVLCAAFIVDAYHSDRALYDLVARIATGALLTQVVLNLQDPGKTVSLSTLRVVLDGPLVMSVLDLSSEESHAYATELVTALREHEASLEVFRHSLEEIRDNLKAVINGVAVGIGYGATARRLHSAAFRAFAAGVLQDVEAAVIRSGIRVIDVPTSQASYRHFTEDDEQSFYSMLGIFHNPLAQQRDAASIAGVMRLRAGRRTRMTAFHQSLYVFVTENPRVAESSAKFLVKKNLGATGDVSPAITDRFLAGLIWILYGGKAAELTRYRLLASCTAALEVRNDVMSKMNRFLRDTDETKARQFRAMMTDERAGQHLMQLTFGDALLVSSTSDAEVILGQLESRYEAKHRSIAEQAIAEAEARASELVQMAEAERERQAQVARDASISETMIRKEFESAQSSAEHERLESKERATEQARLTEAQTRELQDRLAAERTTRIDEKLPLLQQCVARAQSSARRATQIIAGVIGLLVLVGGLLGTEYITRFNPRYSVASCVLLAALAVVSFWNYPELLFGGLVRKMQQRRFDGLVDEYQLSSYLPFFRVDLTTGTITRAPEHQAVATLS
jgi:hypothetical protein